MLRITGIKGVRSQLSGIKGVRSQLSYWACSTELRGIKEEKGVIEKGDEKKGTNLFF
jgi:hypothetical protein